MAKTISLSGFAKELENLDEEMEAAMVTGLRSAALRLQGIVVQEIDNAEPHPAVDRGELRNSVDMFPRHDGAIVPVQSPHAAPMEYGTRPFKPPLEPLKWWAIRKGLTADEDEAEGIALRIQSKFSVDGIAPRGYFAKAWQEMIRAKVVDEEIGAELDQLAKRRSGG